MENLLEILNNGNVVIGILISLAGGFLASFSPCSLYTLPLIIGYVSKEKDSKNSFKYSLLFALGVTVTFVTLGVVSAIIGKRLGIYGKFVDVILAIILLLVALNLFGIIGNKKQVCKVPKLKKNLFMAFLLGILGGVINSPCSAPILIAILTYISAQSNMLLGVICMLFYSIGSSVLIIIAGTSFGKIQKISTNEKYIKIGKILRILFGIITLILALYFLYLFF